MFQYPVDDWLGSTMMLEMWIMGLLLGPWSTRHVHNYIGYVKIVAVHMGHFSSRMLGFQSCSCSVNLLPLQKLDDLWHKVQTVV
jgi:hypothetical protein